jgi:hypothetical protein
MTAKRTVVEMRIFIYRARKWAISGAKTTRGSTLLVINVVLPQLYNHKRTVVTEFLQARTRFVLSMTVLDYGRRVRLPGHLLVEGHSWSWNCCVCHLWSITDAVGRRNGGGGLER